MDSIISAWKPGQSSVGSRAPPGGFGSTNVGLPGKPPRDDHSSNQSGKPPSSAGARNPPSSPGTALPSTSTRSFGTSLTSSDEGGNWEQDDVDEDSIALEGPYTLFHGPAKGLGSKTRIVGSRVFFPGYSSLPGKVRGQGTYRLARCSLINSSQGKYGIELKTTTASTWKVAMLRTRPVFHSMI
jgi:hypothetical protein